MMTFRKTFLITFLLVILLISTFLGGFFLREMLQSQNQIANSFPVFSEAYDLLDKHGLKPLPTAPAVEYGMIRGMLQAYDEPHTSFLEPAQTELETNSLSGKFGGIGTEIGVDPDGFRIFYPFADGPAAKAGIQEGDRLLAIDDMPVDNQTPFDSIVAAIRGNVGTQVNITIGRSPDFEPITYKVERAEITLPSVTWHVDPSDSRVGIVGINIIADTTPEEVKKAIHELQSREATHFILDLRNNSGGLLDAGVDIARLFLNDGDVIQQQFRDEEIKTSRVEKPGEFTAIPLAILVNNNTASAAEIVAGALQARKRAILVGVPTYGKDTIQLVFTLKDNSSLHVTAAHWWIPGVKFPNEGYGLTPDIRVEEKPDDPNSLVSAAIKALLDPTTEN